MKAALIVNKKSKRVNRKAFKELYGFLSAAELEVLEFDAAIHSVADFVDAAVKDQFEVVIAAGGDGTISTVASRLVGTESKLGILPMGTHNNFAKALGIPLNINEAVKVIADGFHESMDVGKINGHFFLNNSSIGIYPHIVVRRERLEGRGKTRFFASLSALSKVFRNFPYYEIKLKTNGVEETVQTPLLFVGNGHYDYDGMDIGKRINISDGLLSMYVLKNANRLDLLKLSFKALIRRIHKDPKFERYSITEAEIKLPKPYVYVAKDGEIIKMKSPLKYEIVPKSLKVILPK